MGEVQAHAHESTRACAGAGGLETQTCSEGARGYNARRASRRPGSRLPRRDAVRALFGDLPSRPTSCMIPRSWTGAMPAMRRRARRFTSFARTDTAVPRKQGGGRC